MKNILFITNNASRTGAPILLLNLIHWLVDNKSKDYKITLLAVTGGPLIEDFRKLVDVKLFNTKTDTKFHYLNVLLNKIQNRKTKLWLKNTNFDLIFSNTIVNGKQIKFLKKGDTPVISYIHELEYSINEYKNLGVVEGTLTKSDFFICGSHMVKNNLIDNHNINPSKTAVVNSFAELKGNSKNKKIAEEIRKSLSIPADSMVVGMMGKLNWRKGADIFANTASRLDSKNVWFLWIGASNQKLMELITYDLDRANKNINIIFLPPSPNFAKYFNIIDLFFLSSREDPYPMVSMEATSYGIPLICFENAGGTQEFIDSKTGELVPYGDPEEAAQKIKFFNDNRSLLIENSSYITEKSIKSHDIELNAPQIVSIIEKFIQK
ncbi:glycosyltransferase [Formosa sp. PL04]|uniref:glycosyltransferase n=1 Tax=Formosa sp. PL04 TaxID=3081755 RepID=UPI0029821F09|nr:glycosyltransferase [Formosa sp. PL04]MDW5290751.1 glycosyltransferase [Formosa sp. PL04]